MEKQGHRPLAVRFHCPRFFIALDPCLPSERGPTERPRRASTYVRTGERAPPPSRLREGRCQCRPPPERAGGAPRIARLAPLR
ncbi:hypothetical protein LV178_05325, partial [Burkholderia mallei]|nr:hypothetical protein [Burkholderia mallei]